MYATGVRFTFEGWHFWAEAPHSCAYLRFPHRHVFHVEAYRYFAGLPQHGRPVEMIEAKRVLSAEVASRLYSDQNNPLPLSCEQMAEIIAGEFGMDYVSVSEDGENVGMFWKDAAK